MRLRTTLAAAIGALALAATLSTPAVAAEGPFTYRYYAEDGTLERAALIDPPSGKCITLTEVADENLPPAHTPRNYTTSAVTVHSGVNCDGASLRLRATDGHASERLKVRSVKFVQ